MKATAEATEEKTGEIMPKDPVATEESKKILAITRGWITNAKLADLRDAYKDITASTAKGYKECVKAIGTVRGLRTKLEKSRLEKNRGDHEKISLRNKEAKRILAALVEIETPLKEMKCLEDERIAKERQEKERIERERVAAIMQRLEDNFGQHCIEDLAGKPFLYVKARIRVIESYAIDDAYQEFKEEAEIRRQSMLTAINRILLARREQEQADKQLQAEKAKLDAQKQEMDNQAKLLKEQQKEFEKERAEWKSKREVKEEAPEKAEAETGQAVEEEPAGEPATEDIYTDIDAETEEQSRVNDLTPQAQKSFQDARIDFSEEEEGDQANRDVLLECVQVETGIKEFNRDDLADLMAIARGMYLSFRPPIRHLAKLVRKELES